MRPQPPAPHIENSLPEIGKPLSVAVALAHCGGELLLIRRARGAYAGWWALPGGKIEGGEHVAAAAERELREEAGLDAAFEAHGGIVSEHLVEDGAVSGHFLLHVCLLSAPTQSVTASDEGELRWTRPETAAATDRLVPSDRAIIERFGRDHGAHDGGSAYHECVMEKQGDAYTLRAFD